MQEKNSNNTKELALGDLAQIMDEKFEESAKMMSERFEKSEKKTDEKLEKLATSIQKEFLELKGETKKVRNEVKEGKSDTEDIKAELNKKVDIISHNDLTYRVEKLEKKFA